MKAQLKIRDDNLMLDNVMFNGAISEQQYREANRKGRVKCSTKEKK